MLFQRNVSDNWIELNLFHIERPTLYMEAIIIDSKPYKRKIAVLLTVGGSEVIDMFNTLSFTD